MSIQASGLIPTWNENVGADFEGMLMRALVPAYRIAHKFCVERKMAQVEKKYLRPQIRHWLAEAALRDVASQLNLQSIGEPNDPFTHHHRLVKSGIVAITQSHVSDRYTMPNYADFRKSLAEDPQRTFQFDDAPETPDATTELYAIIVHSEKRNEPWKIDFVDVIFPVSATKAAGPRISLSDLHRGIIETIESADKEVFEIENIPDPEMPQLLDALRKTGTESK